MSKHACSILKVIPYFTVDWDTAMFYLCARVKQRELAVPSWSGSGLDSLLEALSDGRFDFTAEMRARKRMSSFVCGSPCPSYFTQSGCLTPSAVSLKIFLSQAGAHPIHKRSDPKVSFEFD
jgi:hypothetical protein